MLLVKIFEIIWGVKSGSRLAAEVGEGARYWKCVFDALGLIEEIKRHCEVGAFGIRVPSYRPPHRNLSPA